MMLELRELQTTLESHPEFMGFVRLEQYEKKKHKMTPSEALKMEITRVEAKCKSVIVAQHPTFVSRFPKGVRLFAEKRTTYHRAIFLEKEIYQDVCDRYEVKFTCMSDFLNWLKQISPTGVVVTVEMEKVDRYLYEDPPKMRQFKDRQRFDYGSIERWLKPITDGELLRKKLVKTLAKAAATTLDETTSMYPEDDRHFKITHFLKSPHFPFSERIASMVSCIHEVSGALFISDMFETISEIARYLKLPNVQCYAVLVVAMYRVVFDECFAVSDYIAQYEGQDIIGAASNVTLETLNLPLEFCPVDMDEEKRPREVFRSNEFFGKAIAELELISFCTNPLDVLSHIHHAIKLVERAATIYSSAQVSCFPFEASFGLFLTCLLAADIPELEKIAQFVNDYKLRDGLVNSLEYADSHLMAAVSEIKKLAK